MSAGLVRVLVRQLRRPADAPPTDAEVLRRFAAHHDAEAFAELLRRHGPLVWGVCRRALANRADAEDAFQATFLVLARKAKSVRRPESLGCWLHGVARRVAARVRSAPAGEVADRPGREPPPLDALTMREFVAALDEELARLPDRLRGPLVLCFLQEQTQDEAARRLGVSLSTLKRRLDEGRELLRGRLAGRGVELPAALAAAGLAAGTVPAAVVEHTTTAVLAGGATAGVVALTEGVVRAMWEAKLRAWAVGVAMAATAAGGTGYFAYTGAAQYQPAANKAADDADEKLAAFDEAKARAAVQAAEVKLKQALDEADHAQRLVARGLATQTDAEKAKAAADLAKIDLEVAKLHVQAMATKRAKVRDLRENFDKAADAQAAQPEVRKLREAKAKAAKEAVDGMMLVLSGGAPGQTPESFLVFSENLCVRSKRLMQAEQELDPSAAGRLKAAREHLARMRDHDKFVAARVPAIVRPYDAAAVRFCVIEAELWVKEAEVGGRGARAADLRLDRLTAVEEANRLLAADELQLQAQARAQAQAQDELARSRAEIDQLRRQVDALSAKLAEVMGTAKRPAVPANLQGQVSAVDGELLTITPGADAGLEKGVELEVVRPGGRPSDTPKRLGKLTLVVVTPKEAIGRFVGTAAKPAAADLPKVGDVVRSPR